MHHPKYMNLYKSDELKKRAILLNDVLKSCALCPRKCKVNRLENEEGFCKSGKEVKISSFNAHNGEEPPISGSNGSGTIFFAGCTMRCVFCQNFPISQLGHGIKYSNEEFADIMIKLQDTGCHNINFVTPTHFIPQIVNACLIAVEKGLKIPLVYNTSGYENVEILKLLDGIIDVYLPDIKYTDDDKAFKYSNVKNYYKADIDAVKEMYKQVGNLVLDEQGLALSGLIIRHLVLPHNISNSKEVLRLIAKEISRDAHVSLMSQYFPAHKASNYPELAEKISEEEYEKVVEVLEEECLNNGWIQN